MSTILGEVKPGAKWRRKDTLFALALTEYEDGLCGGCGQPLSRTTGERPHGFAVETYTCSACEELDIAKGREKEPSPGERMYLTPDD